MTKREAPPNGVKPLRKMRAISGYNIWHGDYLRSHASASQSLASSNKESSVLWRSLSEEERERYKEEAKNISVNMKEVNVKKECKKIVNHLQETSEHADALKDCHMMYVVVHKGDHYVGGTEAGVQFLKNCGTYVPYSFLGFLSAKETGFLKAPPRTHNDAEPADKDSLRKAVELLFNRLYGEYTNDARARLPYSKIQDYGLRIDGLATMLKHPSSYGKSTLKSIIENRENLKLYASNLPSSVVKSAPQRCVGKVALPSAFLQKCTKQDVLLIPASTTSHSPLTLDFESQQAEIVKPSSTTPLQHDHTYFRSGKNKLSKRKITPTMPFNVGDKVVLMQNRKCVGMGVVAEGHVLHGHNIPEGSVKVIIEYLEPNVSPFFSGSFDEPLTAGQFAAWPTNSLGRP